MISLSISEIFLEPSPWEFGEVLWKKTNETVGATPKLKSMGVSHSHYSLHSVSSTSLKLHLSANKSLWYQWHMFQVSRSWWWFSGYACLSRFCSGSLTCKLSSLMGPKKYCFSVVQVFLVLRVEMKTSKLFTCQNWN